MEAVDHVPRGYRFLPTAEELVDYLANWVAGTPLTGRAVEFADVYGTEPWNLLVSDRQEGYFFTERKPKNSSGSRVDRKAGSGSWILYKKQELVKSIVGGRKMVVGRRSCLSFKKGQRKNSGWTMYEYEMCSSASHGFQRRVLCHIKKSSQSSYQASGATSIKTVGDESTLPPPTAVVQNPLLASGVASPKSNLSFVDSPASNEATCAKIPAVDDGGGDLGITTEMIEAARISSSSVDHGGEQMHCTLDHSFKNLVTEVDRVRSLLDVR
ncbi:hypothetical protein C4D60_Mb01t11530 [Musa balbisiana]|uniref:NAC domain-containing protein n=1 Tax=Musa balbisiana TaxID=52838 RepID=A0A4S8JLT2_MUSBA|nr:hypothetical protein C4D60_Mb01t11530 [Musa balbisiana]